MIGLNASLTIASQALAAQAGALGITNNNLANINTPGYSRQIVNFSANALSQNGTSVDDGVTYEGFTSVRDELLQVSIYNKTSDTSSLDTQNVSWKQIETSFSGTDSSTSSALSGLFSSLSGLATNPSDTSGRQAVISAAGTLVNTFHQAASTLSSASQDADTQVAKAVSQINGLTKQIANLNGSLASLQANGQDGGALQDQRDQLTSQLAQLTGILSTQTESAPTLSTANGSPLVLGTQALALQVSRGPDGVTHVLDSHGQDITASLTGGTLGGAIAMRDNAIPHVSGQLDTLATQFASAINSAQANGFDANGNAGQAMFTLPTNGSSAAAGISLALTSGASVAASSDTAAGGSGNITNFLAVQTGALPSGLSPSDTYANIVFGVGTSSATASTASAATQAALTQLSNQQAATSGVSVDEETTNLLRFQQAYSAAAKVIATMDQLYSTILNMGGH